jgi:hypothetical protein
MRPEALPLGCVCRDGEIRMSGLLRIYGIIKVKGEYSRWREQQVQRTEGREGQCVLKGL